VRTAIEIVSDLCKARELLRRSQEDGDMVLLSRISELEQERKELIEAKKNKPKT